MISKTIGFRGLANIFRQTQMSKKKHHKKKKTRGSMKSDEVTTRRCEGFIHQKATGKIHQKLDHTRPGND